MFPSPCLRMYDIWRARNEVVFNNSVMNPAVAMSSAMNSLADQREAQECWGEHEHATPSAR